MGQIQQSINAAISSAGRATAAKAGLDEAEKAAEAKQAEAAQKAAQEAEKAKQAQVQRDLKAISAVEPYENAKLMSEGQGQILADLGGQSSSLQEKIDLQRQKLEDQSLSPRQAAGHKGAITRMKEAQSRVQEQIEARQYQKKLLDRRMEVLRSIHGESWGRLGIDPEGGQNGE